jgi:hypothetical protein
MPNYAFGLMALLIPALIGAFLTYDALIRREYHDYNDQWITDGRPKGFFWRAPDWGKTRPEVKGILRSGSLWMIWLFTTPGWAKQDAGVIKLLWQYRILILIWNVGMLMLWSMMGIFNIF